MQCSCCRSESENLREYSLSATDDRNRKTIQTFNLCAICRIVYMIKPLHISARTRQAMSATTARQVA
jgi:hypothetical protein